MASRIAKGIMKTEALEQITEATAGIGALHGIEPLSLPMQGNDPDLLAAQQLVAVAAYLTALRDILEGKANAETPQATPETEGQGLLTSDTPLDAEVVIPDEPPAHPMRRKGR